VEYRASKTRWIPMATGFVAGALSAVLLALVLRRHWDLTTPASLIGLILAAVYAHHFARTVRWKWAAAWVIACGSLMIAMLPAGRMAAVASPAWLGRGYSTSRCSAPCC
jgi:uncharacterized membrane protein